MRTDAKIGFAIVGVLVAVLAVYAIVGSKNKTKKPVNGTVALAPANATPTGPDTPAPSALTGTPGSADNSGQTQPPITPVTLPPHVDQPPLAPPVTPLPNNLGGNTVIGNGGDLTKQPEVLKPDGMTHDPMGHKPPKSKPLPNADGTDTASSTDRYYTIQPGQTLSKIAYEVYGNARFFVAIQRENRGLDPNHLKIGSKIKLPDISPLPTDGVIAKDVQKPDSDLDLVPKLDAVNFPQPSVSHPTVVSDKHTYEVKTGDNLYAIARKVLGSGRKADLLYSLNKDLIGPDKSRLKLGMILKLPEEARTAMAE